MGYWIMKIYCFSVILVGVYAEEVFVSSFYVAHLYRGYTSNLFDFKAK